jgi:hypothetical protein
MHPNQTEILVTCSLSPNYKKEVACRRCGMDCMSPSVYVLLYHRDRCMVHGVAFLLRAADHYKYWRSQDREKMVTRSLVTKTPTLNVY